MTGRHATRLLIVLLLSSLPMVGRADEQPAEGKANAIQPRRVIAAGGPYVAFRPDGKQVAGNVSGETWRPTRIKVWNALSGQEVRTLEHGAHTWQVAFSRDGRRLASNDNYGIKVWDLRTGKQVKSWKTPAFTRCVEFLADGKQLLSGHDDGRIRQWDAATGRLTRTLKGHTEWVPDVALSPDGSKLASASLDLTARIWDLKTGKTVQVLRGHKWYLSSVAWVPGRRPALVTGSDDETAIVWDLKTAAPRWTLDAHDEWVRSVAADPGGKWLATSGNDRTARLWEVASGRLLRTLRHPDDVMQVTFSPDGKTLITTCSDKNTRLWSVAELVGNTTGARAQPVRGRPATVARRDTPLLPTKPYRYADRPVPQRLKEQLKKQLAEADNTPADNRLTDHGATLGRVLFYDTRLSKNGTVACASCHLQDRGFADPRRYSIGFQGGRTGRNAMSLTHLRYSNVRGGRPGFFWDERAGSLEQQALMPIQDPLEMGMTLDALEARLTKTAYYPPLFQAAFGTAEVNRRRVGKAIAQFMRAMVSWNSPYDRAAAKGADPTAEFKDFTAEQNLGKSLFFNGARGVAEMGCAHCHVPPTFAMPKAFNNGLAMRYADPGLGGRDVPTNDPFTPDNKGKFKAPSLRNIELTGPYMHDGRFKTLAEVVAHYSRGVHPHDNLGLAVDEPRPGTATTGFGFSDLEQAALVAFLKTLTDRSFVVDPRFSDPFRSPPPDTSP